MEIELHLDCESKVIKANELIRVIIPPSPKAFGFHVRLLANGNVEVYCTGSNYELRKVK